MAKEIAADMRAAADHIARAGKRAAGRGIVRPPSQKRRPRRPARHVPRSLANMTGEQRLDYLAACDGKITWARYYAKWGPTL